MTNQPTRIWPTIHRDAGYIRTPSGNIIPFAIAGITLNILALIAGVEITFGITNWISIPAALATLVWAGMEIDEATIRHDHDQANEGDQPTT
jgi:hypothetical protein